MCHIHTTIVLYATPTCRRGYIQYKYKYTGYIQYKYKYSTYSTSTVLYSRAADVRIARHFICQATIVELYHTVHSVGLPSYSTQYC